MKIEQKLPGNMKPVETEDRTTDAAGSAEDTENKKKKVKEKRDSTISFRVSKSQREKITSIANECGMSLSDYVLSRAYGYEPKVRLTPEQEAVREQLVIARIENIMDNYAVTDVKGELKYLTVENTESAVEE